MSLINITTIGRDFNALQKCAGTRFLDDYTKDLLEKSISSEVKRLIVEKPYIDKDFRDTYYNDFSKRFKDISRDSIRVLLLNDDNGYLGFFTLRDTSPFNIGRSYINPRAVSSVLDVAYYCLTLSKVNYLGYELQTEAFPWMQQDANVSRCAHIAMWEVIRYFSDKYNRYHEITLNRISQMVDDITRKVPSNGLTVSQIAQVMTKAGFSVDLYFREKDDTLFNKLIYVFIESGIPLICGLQKKIHAISIIGHSAPDLTILKNRSEPIVDSSELVESFISCDDNLLPYSVVNKNSSSHHIVEDVDVIVAPLYEKMYIGGDYLLRHLLPELEKILHPSLDNKQLIRRVLLTSSNSFKKFVLSHSKDEIYKSIISRTLMPKFIWVVEYAYSDKYPQFISHRIILDSTALNHSGLENIIINCKLENYMSYRGVDNSNFTTAQLNLVDDLLYVNNLTEIRK